MTDRGLKNFFAILVLGVCFICSSTSYVDAANISEFVNITPYLEIGAIADDNIYEIAEDVPLPDGQSSDDVYLDTRAGVGVDLTLERRLLK